VSCATRSGSGGVGESEGATVFEGAADGEDDAERHGGGENGGHGCDDGTDGVVDACGANDEPEEGVGEVDEQDGAVEVQAVTEHELPWTQRAGFEGVDGAHESQTERDGIEKSGCDPVYADPGMLGTCDTSLA